MGKATHNSTGMRALCLAATAGACAAQAQVTVPAGGLSQLWLYPDMLGRGPSNWGSIRDDEGATMYPVCRVGLEQSPVDIVRPQPNRDLRPLQYHYEPAQGYLVANLLNTLDIIPKNVAQNYVIDPNLGGKNFTLKGIHFHTPSEHSIGGSLYELEMHFVYRAGSIQPPTASIEYNILVVAVLFSVGKLARNEVFDFFDDLPGLPLPNFEHYEEQRKRFQPTVYDRNRPLDFNSAIPSDRYFTYKGSLTVPPCTENLKWYVCSDIGRVGEDQLNSLRAALGFEAERQKARSLGWKEPPYFVMGNRRPMQPLNGRQIWAYDGHAAGSSGSSTEDSTLDYLIREHLMMHHPSGTDNIRTLAVVALTLAVCALVASVLLVSGLRQHLCAPRQRAFSAVKQREFDG